jgi:hypothetical protein
MMVEEEFVLNIKTTFNLKIQPKSNTAIQFNMLFIATYPYQ